MMASHPLRAPSPEREIRVGLVGYGTAGACFHAPLLAAVDGLTVTGVVTSDVERSRQAREELGPQTQVFDTADALLSRSEEYDLVVIAAPNRAHVPLARRALSAGLHVVVDKPLAPTAEEAVQLAELAEERGLLLSVFQNRRLDNDFRTVRALLERGALGDVHRFESRFERWRPTPKGGWRESGDPQEFGGLRYDLGSHLVDQALVLFGPVTSVYAEVDIRRPSAAADDDVFLALTHAGGVRSHLWASALAPQLGPRFRVLGSAAGYVKYGLDPQEAAVRAGARPTPGRPWGVEPEADWGLLGTIEESHPVPSLAGDYPAYYHGIVRALREGTPPEVTAWEAAAALRVLEAAQVSAAEGRVVALDERPA